LLLLAAFSFLAFACSDDRSEPVAKISSRDDWSEPDVASTVRKDGVAASAVGQSGNRNAATLTWDAVHHPRLRGYRIYYGPAPGDYLQPRGQGIDAGNVTTYVIEGLASDRRYYFVVTAIDTSNGESDFSNEVFTDTP
jgi:hypothetical protein